MNKFNFFRSYMEALEDLPPDEFKAAVMAICHYAFDGEQDEVTGGAKVAFKLIAPIIDRGEEISAIRSEVGAKGAAARWKNKANDSKSMANDSKPMANEWQTDSKAMTLPMANDSGIGIGEGIGIGKGNIKENTRAKYGEYKHVLLSADELAKLNAEYGEEKTQRAIAYLDEYIEYKGAKYKNHYLVMRKWVYKALDEHKEEKPKIKFNNFEERIYDFAALEAELRGEK